MTGSYQREAVSRETANSNAFSTARRWFQQWNYGFNLSWELDFWGRFRRAVEAADATLDASVEDYDAMLVTLLGDIATNYTNLRTLQQRILYARENIELQRKTLKIVKGRASRPGPPTSWTWSRRSTLEQTEAQIPELEIGLRQTNNQLCILLGIAPEDLEAILGKGPIPTAPVEVAAGIPADLLRRRPDVRRAERQAAAQSAMIGIAEAEFYPHIAINGMMGWSAQHLNDLFRDRAFTGNFGPSFQWNILNYGRLLNEVRYQDARFQELVAAYQEAVLIAGQEVENGLVTFLLAQQRSRLQAASVEDADRSVTIALAQYTAGAIDLTRVTLLEQTLVQQQDTLAQARGEIATGLIQVYRALGGGWQIRCTGCDAAAVTATGSSATASPATPGAAPAADKGKTGSDSKGPDTPKEPAATVPPAPSENQE